MNATFRHALLAAVAVAISFPSGTARADDAQALAQRFLDTDAFGFEGADLKARLDLTDPSGAVQERTFESWSKRGADRMVRTVLRFTGPANMAGTAFLLIQHAGAPSEQYVYLPRMKTTRRVGGTSDRDGSFAGSDFTYADFERSDLREATWSRNADETIGKDACNVLVATPKDPKTYSRIVAWVRPRDAMPLRIQFFGADGALDKTLFTRKIATFGGKPAVTELHVENARTGHKTDLFVDDLAFRDDLDDSLFTPGALDR